MPRKPRDIEPGAAYHLISRFVDREWFIQKELERKQYLSLLGRALERSRWRLIAYAVMSNHIHLGVIAGDDPLHGWIRRVHSPFAQTMNRTYDRIGSVFVRGPKSYVVERFDVANLVAYIHNNPVRAGVVASARETTWTSHRAYIGQARCPSWLHVSEGLDLMRLPRGTTFDQWVAAPERRAIDDDFTEEAHERRLTLLKEQAPPTEMSTPQAADILKCAAELVGVSAAQICSRSRYDKAVVARTVAVRCALSFGLSGSAVANSYRISQQGVSVIQRRATDRQTDALVREAIERITRHLPFASSASSV